LILEYEAILTNHNDTLGLSKSDIKDFIDYICSIGNQTEIFYLWRPILKDPFDDHVSINQFIASAIAEKITALETETYIKNRGESGSKDRFLKVLDKVKDREPDRFDT